MDADDSEADRQHELIFRKLFDETETVLKDFVHRELIGPDDYWLVDEDWGWDVLQIELPLSLAWPALVRELQVVLLRYADWRVTIRLADRGLAWALLSLMTKLSTI